MSEEKQPQELKEKCCDEEQKLDECCDEETSFHNIDECCDGKKKMIIKLPFGRKTVKDMKDFAILKIIHDKEGEGITGYELGKDFPRGSVIRKLDELKEQGLLRSEEEESDGKKKVKYYTTEKGKKHIDTLFSDVFSFLGEDVKPVFHKKIFLEHDYDFKFNIDKLETKEEIKDFLASLRHKLNIAQKELQSRLQRLQKARTALDGAIEKVDRLSEFSSEVVKKILDEIRDEYQDVWKNHLE